MKKEDIHFENGKSNDMGRGFGNGNPKISFKIKGIQKRWKALFRGDDRFGAILSDVVVAALSTDKAKQYLIDYRIADDTFYNIKSQAENKVKLRTNEILESSSIVEPTWSWGMEGEEKLKYKEYSEKKDKAEAQAEEEIYGGSGFNAIYDWENNHKRKIYPEVPKF